MASRLEASSTKSSKSVRSLAIHFQRRPTLFWECELPRRQRTPRHYVQAGKPWLNLKHLQPESTVRPARITHQAGHTFRAMSDERSDRAHRPNIQRCSWITPRRWDWSLPALHQHVSTTVFDAEPRQCYLRAVSSNAAIFSGSRRPTSRPVSIGPLNTTKVLGMIRLKRLRNLPCVSQSIMRI